jgi:hypothetical protein
MGLLKRLKNRLDLALSSDTAFIETAYYEILGRPPDVDGLNHYRHVLEDGMGRTAVLLEIIRSEEFLAKLERNAASLSLPNLREKRAERYSQAKDRTNGNWIAVFNAASPSDFDWLESAIIDFGYYEKPGVWILDVDTDKRVVAEIIASFAPQHPLELGCAAGAVLECLDDHGIAAEGVEISSMAIAKASPCVRERIHQGDLRTLNLSRDYDMVFGLDVFEHLNPNRMDDYLSCLERITTADAHVFCNIPAFGTDPVFGTVFPLYIDGWEDDAAHRRPFRTIHVDERGYPIHGHLTWADWEWWVQRFAAHGFRREVEIERALHEKYDAYMTRQTPARLSYFVFSKSAGARQCENIIQRVRDTRSGALQEPGNAGSPGSG